MGKSRTVCVSLVVILLVSLLPLTTPFRAGAAQAPAPLEPELVSQLQAEGSANYFVKMEAEANLSPAEGMDWDARGEFVWRTLNEVARTSQAPVLDYCHKNGLDCTSMLVTNSVFVRAGNMTTAQALAAVPGVAYLRLERILPLPDPVAGGAGINGFQSQGAAPETTIDWGITDTQADQVWALGYKGSGIKVAGIDTGVQWDHPALVDSFACPGDPTDARCWYDPSNTCGGSACDNNGHGTHTMGTMVANDDSALPYIAGMAPDATWIACKGCEGTQCSESSLTACADWILAPGGNTANRPHIVNNSWGGGSGDDWYLASVQAWRAAGIFPAFSAGNAGNLPPFCSTLSSPGDYQESLASAAHDNGRAIASFSSRGPSTYGHTPYTKPNISAPGVSICSTVPTNGWECGYSGTSMASPHTAGAVALLWQACPTLIGQMDATFEILQDNADAPPAAGLCGAPPDGEGNYAYGYGYLNALRAVQSCFGPTGTLAGHVTDQDNLALLGATVTASNGASDTTDGSGYYQILLPPGTYSATATHPNYSSSTANDLVITAGSTTSQDFKLSWVGGWVDAGLGSGCPNWTRYDAEYYAPRGRAYLLGGRSGETTYGDIYAFDPATGTCTDTRADMQTPISNYTIVTLPFAVNRLCTFGGRDSAGTIVRTVQCYSPDLNNVVTKLELPAVFAGYLPGGVEVVNNKAYIFGGFSSTAAPYNLAVTYEYDPASNTYAAKGDLAQARGYLLTAVADGQIYAFGGDIYDGTNLVAQTKAERFDPAAGTWSDSAVPDLAVASGEGRAFGFDRGSVYSLAGRIVLAGGGQWSNDTAEALAYSLDGGTYDYDFADLNVARRDHAAFFQPGDTARMWVVGGYSSAAGYGGDNPPYAPAEYYGVVSVGSRVFLPLVLRDVSD